MADQKTRLEYKKLATQVNEKLKLPPVKGVKIIPTPNTLRQATVRQYRQKEADKNQSITAKGIDYETQNTLNAGTEIKMNRYMQTLLEANKKRSKKPGSGGSNEAPEASAEQVGAAAAELRGGITIDPKTGKKTGPITRARKKLKIPRKSNPEGVPRTRKGDVTREMP